MPIAEINYFAVVVGAIVNMVIGSVWYAPQVFGKTWMRLIGHKQEDMKKGAARAYGLMFVVALIMSYVLAHFVDYTQSTTFSDGAVCGFWIWLGFVATTASASVIFEKRPAQLYYINVGYYLVALLIMGGILAVWQ